MTKCKRVNGVSLSINVPRCSEEFRVRVYGRRVIKFYHFVEIHADELDVEVTKSFIELCNAIHQSRCSIGENNISPVDFVAVAVVVSHKFIFPSFYDNFMAFTSTELYSKVVTRRFFLVR